MPASATKAERFEIRMSTADKNLIAEAARLRGMTPTEFVLKATLKASKRTVERVKVLKFSRRDQVRLLEALMNPPEPNERLKKAAARHARLVKRA
jgi:uncharacterized protein (DUF1778 family)